MVCMKTMAYENQTAYENRRPMKTMAYENPWRMKMMANENPWRMKIQGV